MQKQKLPQSTQGNGDSSKSVEEITRVAVEAAYKLENTTADSRLLYATNKISEIDAKWFPDENTEIMSGKHSARTIQLAMAKEP